MRVGVFDSGLGGLNILKSLIDKKPNNEYIYFGDTINLPYGNKSKEELLLIADRIIKFMIDSKVDIIIIACGTISSNLYDDIKDKYGVKIVDLITPIVADLKTMNVKKVGLLGTKMTILSKVFENKIEKIGINVIPQACPAFVDIIENRSTEPLDYYIDKYLKNLKYSKLDLIIPGCTHYPLIKKEIYDYLKVDVMDIGSSVCKYIDLVDSKNSVKLYFSLLDDEIKENVKKILGNYDIEEKRIDW
ncbi:MAG TPA: glutamate racemase [Bacilli bacterium]|nr:glutamate racemase [Bacilli bacterium]